MNQDEVKITAQPISTQSCRFTLDRAVYPNASFYFSNPERAKLSPLADKLFAIEGISSVLISHDEITVSKRDQEEWPLIARQVGAAIREVIESGLPVVTEEAKSSLPSSDEIREKVEQIIESEINPSVASHGGVIQLIDVRDNDVFIQMGGGCQGCGMAAVTLKHGVETAIRRAVPEVGAILDTTDHAAGRNPYYSSATSK